MACARPPGAAAIAIHTRNAYMFASVDIAVELDCAEDDWAIVVVTTPIGKISIAGALRWEGRTLHVTGAHIGGLKPGALGRKGLNAVGRKLLEAADVDKIIIEGADRTTGRNPGRAPKRFCFPHD
jgi:hypothetical protein